MSSVNKKPAQKNTKKPEEKNNVWQKLALFIPIWVQIIICVTAVASSPIIIGKILETPAPVLTTPTDTAVPISLIGNSVAVTVLDTSVPVLLPGQDWGGNCINSTIWRPYLAGETKSESSQCYQLSEWGINAERGRLIFASNRSQSRGYEYGILTPWHNWSEVNFTVDAARLENSEIWFGFFEGDTPDSTGIIFIIQPGDEIDIRAMPYETKVVDNIDLKFAGGKFHPRVIFEGGKIAVWVDGQGIISEWPINFTIRNMFVGYRALPSMNLNAAVFDLKFKP